MHAQAVFIIYYKQCVKKCTALSLTTYNWCIDTLRLCLLHLCETNAFQLFYCSIILWLTSYTKLVIHENQWRINVCVEHSDDRRPSINNEHITWRLNVRLQLRIHGAIILISTKTHTAIVTRLLTLLLTHEAHEVRNNVSRETNGAVDNFGLPLNISLTGHWCISDLF